MRYTVLFCSNTGAKRVKPGQARSESHARRPTPRRLSVFCSTTLDIRISNAYAEPVVAEDGHFANNPTRQAGEVQCLGQMPWVSRATALRPDPHQLRQTRSSVNSRSICGLGQHGVIRVDRAAWLATDPGKAGPTDLHRRHRRAG